MVSERSWQAQISPNECQLCDVTKLFGNYISSFLRVAVLGAIHKLRHTQNGKIRPLPPVTLKIKDSDILDKGCHAFCEPLPPA